MLKMLKKDCCLKDCKKNLTVCYLNSFSVDRPYLWSLEMNKTKECSLTQVRSTSSPLATSDLEESSSKGGSSFLGAKALSLC